MTTNTNSGYIAIPALAGSHYMGATVFWSRSGAVEGARLEAAWAEAELDASLLPYLPSAEVALGRAARDAASKRGYWAEKLPRDAAEFPGAWVIAERKPRNAKDLQLAATKSVSFPLYAIVDLVSGSPAILATPVDGADMEEAWKASFLPEIEERFRFHLDHLSVDDISTWTIGRLLPLCRGLKLKPNEGHIYFIHGKYLSEWRKMIDALKQVSQHVFIEIPTVPVAEALAAVTFAIQESVKTETDRVEAALRRHYEGEETLGKLALKNRIELSEQVEQQVVAYEELLGTSLDTLHDRLRTLRASLTAAMLEERSPGLGIGGRGLAGAGSVLDDVL